MQLLHRFHRGLIIVNWNDELYRYNMENANFAIENN